MEDKDDQDLRPILADVANCIAAAILSGGKALFHCQLGASRSATFMAYYLMESEGLDAATALSTIKAARPKANTKLGFRSILREFNKLNIIDKEIWEQSNKLEEIS